MNDDGGSQLIANDESWQAGFGEMLDSDGTVYRQNLRAARATETYICRGGGEEQWKPRFTYHGFKYVEVEGLPEAAGSDALAGIIVCSDLPPTGSFECSNEIITRTAASGSTRTCWGSILWTLAFAPSALSRSRGDFTWAKGHYDSPRGSIGSDWKIEGQKFSWEVQIPANTTATVHVPAAEISSVTESGQSVADVAAIKFLRTERSYAVFSLASGNYRFQSILPTPAK